MSLNRRRISMVCRDHHPEAELDSVTTDQGQDHASFQLDKMNCLTELNCNTLPQEALSSISSKMKDVAAEIKVNLRREKIKMWKNIIMLDLAIFFYHSPMMTYTNLMSSLLSDEGQGVASESINAGIMLFGSLILCTYGTKRWSSKRVILVACVLIIPYLLINFHVVWGTIIPGSILAGLGDCLIAQAVSVYYSDLASYHSKVFGSERESFLLKMFGLCGVVTQSSFILGNVLVWAILDTRELWPTNETLSLDVSYCGIHFCPDNLNSNNQTISNPQQWRVYTLCGIFTAMGVLAVVTTIFLDDYSLITTKTVPKLKEIVSETTQLLCHPQQLLLVMISIVIGMAEGFFFGDYTQAYVSCTIGISQVGLVMTCYGLVDGISAACQETLSGWFGRVPVMILGSSLLGSLMFVLLNWQPSADSYLMFYVVAAIWGMADGIISTHISTLYGTLYEDKTQVAYSCQTFWYGVGLCVSFGYSYYLCVSVKLYILFGVIVAAMIGYYILEFHIYFTRTKNLKTKVNELRIKSDDNPSVRTISACISEVELLDI